MRRLRAASSSRPSAEEADETLPAHGRPAWHSSWPSARRPKSWPGSTSGPARSAASRSSSSASRAGSAARTTTSASPTSWSRCSLNIHGETRHVGKVPKRCASSAEQQTQLIRLRREMKEAIAAEEYERASKLRDEIRKIESAREPSKT